MRLQSLNTYSGQDLILRRLVWCLQAILPQCRQFNRDISLISLNGSLITSPLWGHSKICTGLSNFPNPSNFALISFSFFFSFLPLTLHLVTSLQPRSPICISCDTSSNFWNLFNSHCASLSCPLPSAWLFPLFFFELCHKMESQFLLLPGLPTTPHHTLYLAQSIWLPFFLSAFTRLSSLRLHTATKRSNKMLMVR